MVWKDYEELADDARYTPQYQELYSKRKETIERVFADAKEKHGMRSDMGRLVGGIRHNGLNFREGLCHFAINIGDGYREYCSVPKICAQCPTRQLCTHSKNCVKTVLRHVWKNIQAGRKA